MVVKVVIGCCQLPYCADSLLDALGLHSVLLAPRLVLLSESFTRRSHFAIVPCEFAVCKAVFCGVRRVAHYGQSVSGAEQGHHMRV